MAECRSCGAQIVWALTEKGLRMPLDAAPDARRGNVALHEDGTCRILGDMERLLLHEVDGDEAELYLSHFASCPNAAGHRRRG